MASEEHNSLMQRFYLDHWLIDPAHGCFETKGHRIHIEPKVMDVLLCLARNHGQVVTRGEILDEVWRDLVVSEEVLTRCISELRTALNDTSRERKFIKTVPKRGYCLIVKPVVADAESPNPVIPPTDSDTPSATTNSAETEASITDQAEPPMAQSRPKSVFNRWIGQETIITVALVAIVLVYKWASERPEDIDDTPVALLAATDPDPNVAENPVQQQRLDVAVLPFVNINPNGEDDYFSVGLAEDIRNQLIRTDGLRVAARTSSEVFLGRAMDIRDIGETLNTRMIVEGTVRMDDSRIRLTVQLSDVDNGHPVWAETYERDRLDVFALQDEIATEVVKQLAPALTQSSTPPPAEFLPNNVQAYDNYLLGRFHWNKRTSEGVERAQLYFQRAIDLDPNYAAAYAGMADSILVSPKYSKLDLDEHQALPDDITAQVEGLINKALQLNPQDSEANASRGLLAHLQNDTDTAEAYFQRALALNPNNSMAQMWWGNLKTAQGYPQQAFDLFQSALNLDPLHPSIQSNYLSALLILGKTQELLASAPYFYNVTRQPSALKYQLLTYMNLGQFSKALAFAKSPDLSEQLSSYAYLESALAFIALGHFDQASRLIEEFEPEEQQIPQWYDVQGQLALAQSNDEALATLIATATPLYEQGQLNQCDYSYLLRYKGILAWMNRDITQAEDAFIQSLEIHQDHCKNAMRKNIGTLSYLVMTANYREDQTLAQQRYNDALNNLADAKQRGIHHSDLLIDELKLHLAMGELSTAHALLVEHQAEGRNPYGWISIDPLYRPMLDQLFPPQPDGSTNPFKEAYIRDQRDSKRITIPVLDS